MAIAYPEAVCLRDQMAGVLVGKEITDVSVVDVAVFDGDWRYGSIIQPPLLFRSSLRNGTVTGVDRVANSLFLNTDTGHALGLGYLSGRVTYHDPGEPLPKRSCLSVRFADDSHLSAVISLWGLVRVLDDAERVVYVARWHGSAVEPRSERFTWEGFHDAVSRIEEPRLSIKKFLHAFEPGYYVSGLDAGYALEILHRAGVHPKRKLRSLTLEEQHACYNSVNLVAQEAIDKGGRYSEVDLYGRPGGFMPHVCKARLDEPCPVCGTRIEKFPFEGASCYVGRTCQPLGR
ncbi:MAG: hypothetical protein MUQ10_14210 [Anaerolineae bacterium]|nr:hypothetical protein [Anaerolineae bacterium]